MKINVEKLNVTYGAKKVIIDGFASFDEGKIYGIVGKNGAGKTTFFKSLTNIITNYGGQVTFDGQDVRQFPSVLTKVGILLDDIELYKSYTGWFNLRYFGGLRGTFDEDNAMKLAVSLEISDVLNKKVLTYSLGMTKKLLLLISLMNDAEVLIFDEPLRGIDADAVRWFRHYLLDFKRKGKTILISSHVQEDIESLCDEVFVLSEGKFPAPIDLTDQNRLSVYKVFVNELSALTSLLEQAGLRYQVDLEQVIFEAEPKAYQEIFQAAVNQGLVFKEIRKEAKFSEHIN